jgi:hypothetical protein
LSHKASDLRQPHRATPFRARFAGIVVVVFAVLVAIDAAMYKFAQLFAGWEKDSGDPFVSTAWPSVAVDVLACIGVLIAVIYLTRGNRRIRLALSMLAVGVTFLSSHLALGQEGVPVPAIIQAAPSPSATISAQHAMQSANYPRTCITLTSDPTRLLPTPYQQCAGSTQVQYLADWNANTPSEYGFVYSPGGKPNDESDMCVRSLGNSWWALMGQIDPVIPCASGFQFIEAP